jgi:hypothetical protein
LLSLFLEIDRSIVELIIVTTRMSSSVVSVGRLDQAVLSQPRIAFNSSTPIVEVRISSDTSDRVVGTCVVSSRCFRWAHVRPFRSVDGWFK